MTAPPDLVDLALTLKLATDGAIDLTTQQLARAWSQAWDEIAQEWREALTELAGMAEDGRWPTRAQITRNVRAQAALQATAEALQHLTEQTQATVTGDLSALVQLAADHQQAMLAAQLPTGHRLPPVAYDPAAVAAIVGRTTQQITALTWPLRPEAEAAMRASLIRGMAVGDNPRKVAADMLNRVQGVFDGGKARAVNIARTEMISAYRTATQEREKLHTDVLKGWIWTADLTSRTCAACIAMDGTFHELDEPGPLGHPSCRCARTDQTKTWKELGFDIPEPGRLEDRQTGPEWFEEQPEATQRKILGPKRFAAWREGNYPPSVWAVRRENPAWRASYGVGPVPSSV